jgi:hypothetical protein
MPEDRELLDSKVLAYLNKFGGSTAWAMRGEVGEKNRKVISKSLQRLKRKGLVRTDTLSSAYWKPVTCGAVDIGKAQA